MTRGTTQVRILVSVAGPDFSWIPGQIVDLPIAEAAKWADGVRGEYVNMPAPPADEPPTGDGPVDEAPPVDEDPAATTTDAPPAGDDQPDREPPAKTAPAPARARRGRK